jgi:6-phosphogluconolactonase
MRRAIGVVVLGCLLACGDSADGGGGTTVLTDTVGSTPTGGPSPDSGPEPDDGVDDDPLPMTSATTGSTGPADDTMTPTDTTGAPAEPGPIAVYVTDGQSTIHLFSVDESSGALTPVATYDTDPQVSQLALHPDGLHLYATVRGGGSNRVLTYAIDPASGELTPLGDTPLTLDPVYVAIDESGGWAMFADFGGDEISVHAVGGDFVVVEGPADEQSVGNEPHAIVPAPGGDHVYVPHRGTNEIRQFALDVSSGALTPLNPSAEPAAPGAGARHLAFDPTGTHAYLSDEFSDTVTHFSRDPVSGLLTRLESVSTLPRGMSGDDNTTADCHVTPDGAFVYVSNRGHDSLAMFAADPATGVVTSIGQVDTVTTPREFEVDPTGRFAWAAGQGDGEVAAYSIDGATGQLTPAGTVSVGGSPLWVKAVELPPR